MQLLEHIATLQRAPTSYPGPNQLRKPNQRPTLPGPALPRPSTTDDYLYEPCFQVFFSTGPPSPHWSCSIISPLLQCRLVRYFLHGKLSVSQNPSISSSSLDGTMAPSQLFICFAFFYRLGLSTLSARHFSSCSSWPSSLPLFLLIRPLHQSHPTSRSHASRVTRSRATAPPA